MAPFLWMEFNCLTAKEPLRGGSLLFTAKKTERWKAESILEQSSGFEHETPGLGIQLGSLTIVIRYFSVIFALF